MIAATLYCTLSEFGCYGDPLAKSPNIDQFAKAARRFNRAYVQQAVCGPSRTSLLTGLLPDHTQVWHNHNRFRETRPNHVTLPQLFKQNGYRTVGFEKIFSGNEKELDPISWSEPEILRRKGWKNYVLPHNLDLNDHTQTEHFVTLTLYRDDGTMFHLARYHDIDADTHGPMACAAFFGLGVADMFPIAYDIDAVAVGVPASVRREIPAEPARRLDDDELVRMAVSG